MINRKDKKGYSLSGWTEIALFSVPFMLMVIIVVTNMNVKYGQNYDSSFGLSTAGDLGNFTEYQNTIQSGIREGEASTNVFGGISLTSTWAMVKSGLNIIWGFITGSWIEKSTALMRLPSQVGLILRILYVLSIGYIAIKLLLKVGRP